MEANLRVEGSIPSRLTSLRSHFSRRLSAGAGARSHAASADLTLAARDYGWQAEIRPTRRLPGNQQVLYPTTATQRITQTQAKEECAPGGSHSSALCARPGL